MNRLSDLFLGQLRELDRAECLELIGQRSVGRVAYSEEAGPVVLPVNHVLIDGEIWFRVAPYSQLATELQDRVASFEVDDFDEFNQTGWSVLVRGVAHFGDPDALPRHDQRPVPWPQGQRTLHIRIVPRSISGRRLLPG